MTNKSLLVSLIGMDGAGKTTTSKKLLKELKKKKFKVKYIYVGRGRNNILPIQFFGKKIKIESSIEKDKDLKKRKLKKNNISLIHTLGAPIFSLDLLLRYYFQIKPLKKKYDIIITDRYTTDILLMNKVPKFLKKSLYYLFPKPELSFYLYNDINILHKRKKHPIADLKRQKKIFNEINKLIKPIEIKTDDLNITINEILKHIQKN